MKKPIKFYVVGTLLLAPVLGLIANQVFAQELTLKTVPSSSSRFAANTNKMLAQTTPRVGGRVTPSQFGSSANGGDFNYGRAGAERYQLVIDSNNQRYIFDTATGRLWVQSSNSDVWSENTPKELKDFN